MHHRTTSRDDRMDRMARVHRAMKLRRIRDRECRVAIVTA